MKKDVYALRYNSLALRTLPILLLSGIALWSSGEPIKHGRMGMDFIQHGTTKFSHTHTVVSQHSNSSHCTPGSCGCGKTCSCDMSGGSYSTTETTTDDYTTAEYALAEILTAAPLILILGMLTGNLSKVLVSDAGIAFPFYMVSDLVGRRSRKWTDLGAVSLFGEEKPKSAELHFKFRSKGNAALRLSKFNKRDLKRLLQALNDWSDKKILSENLVDYIRSELGEDYSPVKDASFTEMWEEEMSSHMAATTFVPLAVGTSLQSGKLKVVALLATGGLSAVYLAERSDKTTVVLKESVVPQHIDEKTRQKAKELFEREAKLLLKLNHPKIAKVLDHVLEGGRDYLVLEYIPGQSLRQVIKRMGPASEDVVIGWTKQIAQILEYLHELNPPIVHRDLTPDNLVLKENGNISLIDFGAANEYVGTATGTLIGKQSFISPEQFRGKATPASDIYALGGTMFFLLTGEEPEALSVSHPSEKRQEISSVVDELVAACTELDEEDRISSARDLEIRLGEIG